MKTIILVRHAETVLAGRFCGMSDPELSATGIAQLSEIVQRIELSEIDRILSSDLLRARQTAEAIAQAIGVPVELRPGLREINFGLWEGLHWDEIEAQFPREARTWRQEFPGPSAPEGEPFADFLQRLDDEFLSILAGNEDERVVIVSHMGVIRFALTRIFGYSWNETSHQEIPYGAVIPVVYSSAVMECR
jgi:broad specificity phosphatase PhoE